MPDRSVHAERILVWAPTARDAELAVEILGRHGMRGHACAGVEALCDAIAEGAGAGLIAEERLSPAATARLAAALATQPAWSDLPLVVLGIRRTVSSESSPNLEPLGNVTLLDPPLRVRTLVRASRSALRDRRRQYQARRAIEQRDKFLAMLGHELRNPLSAISLAGYLIKEGNDPQRHLVILQRQVAQLTRLVDDLLDIARVSSGKLQIRRRPVDLASVIAHAVDALRGRFDEEGLSLEVAITPCAVRGDSARLEQVFGNLLTNALKYTPRGGRVAIRAFPEGNDAVVFVEDTGIGIDEEMLPAIFDEFVQVQASRDRSQGGMGVGLSLVRTLVDLHEGEVRAESEGPGRGSRFTVRLPLAAPSERPGPHPRKGDAPPADQRSLVLVEDNEDARELLVLALESMGYRVDAAADGACGVELVTGAVPDAAIVDIGLPILDGYEVAQRVRAALGGRVRLIALSGYGQPADRERALEAGFDAHLTKPADLSALRNVLDQLFAATPLG